MYTPVPLSGDLYEQAKADGFAFPDTLEEWVSAEWQEFVQRRSATMPWMHDPVRKRIRNFERVLNAHCPTTTHTRLRRYWHGILKVASAWRYHAQFYGFPIELRALHRLIRYQRPETTGF